ncbi:MAG: hypothetical protein R3B06_03040 [Kofleriaceae bacterium]
MLPHGQRRQLEGHVLGDLGARQRVLALLVAARSVERPVGRRHHHVRDHRLRRRRAGPVQRRRQLPAAGPLAQDVRQALDSLGPSAIGTIEVRRLQNTLERPRSLLSCRAMLLSM